MVSCHKNYYWGFAQILSCKANLIVLDWVSLHAIFLVQITKNSALLCCFLRQIKLKLWSEPTPIKIAYNNSDKRNKIQFNLYVGGSFIHWVMRNKIFALSLFCISFYAKSQSSEWIRIQNNNWLSKLQNSMDRPKWNKNAIPIRCCYEGVFKLYNSIYRFAMLQGLRKSVAQKIYLWISQ